MTIEKSYEGLKKNAQGHFVPVEQISEYELMRSNLVEELCKNAEDYNSGLKDLKLHGMSETKAMLDIGAEKYGQKEYRGKGNYSMSSFDGQYQIQVKIQDTLAFDERLTLAKQAIDEFMVEEAEGANEVIRTLVFQAFDVNKEGNVSVTNLLKLLKHDFDKPKWQEAMKILKDSLSVESSKAYIHFKKRCPLTNEMKIIPLDIARV